MAQRQQPVEDPFQFFQSFYGGSHTFFIFNNHTRESTPSKTTAISIIIPALVGLVEIKYALNSSQAHSIVATMICVFSMVIHYLASRAKRCWFPNYASQLGVVMDVTASVSVASLVSLVVPHSWWPMRCILYILLVLLESHHYFTRMFAKYFGRFFNPWPMRNEERLLPLTYMDTQVHGSPYHRASPILWRP